MQLLDGALVMSAADLNGFVGCTHRTSLDRLVALGRLDRPVRDNPLGELFAAEGMARERSYLAEIQERHPDLVEVSPGDQTAPGLAAAEAATLAAMSSGASVIYQATFFDPPWRGHADFLLRVEAPSALGPWSYEVADTKLHQKASKSDWIQVAFYSQQVARLQGHLPTLMHIVVGDGSTVSCAVDDLSERVEELEAAVLSWTVSDVDIDPEPVTACTNCRWRPRCDAQWAAVDHLSLLGIHGAARTRLSEAGFTTVAGLAAAGADTEVVGVKPEALRRFRSDARLVLHERATGQPHLRLRYPREGEGLELLPQSREGDLFLDLEGYGYTPHGQLEYLFGVTERTGAGDVYHAFWAHTRQAEGQAFAATVALLLDRLEADPSRHVYHYNHYEPHAFRRLAQTHGRLANEVAALCDGPLVDLLPIARLSIRTSGLSSGLKALEPFYRPARSEAVTSAAGSMVDYAAWLHSGDDALLAGIEAYNRADCESTADLRDWLRGLADDVAEARAGDLPDHLAELATEPDLRARLVAAHGTAGASLLVRQTLVALDFEESFDAFEVAALLWVAPFEIEDWLVRGKKELGIPIALDQLQKRSASRSG